MLFHFITANSLQKQESLGPRLQYLEHAEERPEVLLRYQGHEKSFLMEAAPR